MSGGGFEQCYNAQSAVATDSMLVAATGLKQAANDKQQVEPILQKLVAFPTRVGQAEQLFANSGYGSQTNLAAYEAAGVEPFARRQQTVEPVLGIIQLVMGFRQFLLRGISKVHGRVDPGVSGVKCETHGRIAPEIRDKGINKLKEATKAQMDSLEKQPERARACFDDSRVKCAAPGKP
jgi:hypothetical protein